MAERNVAERNQKLLEAADRVIKAAHNARIVTHDRAFEFQPWMFQWPHALAEYVALAANFAEELALEVKKKVKEGGG